MIHAEEMVLSQIETVHQEMHQLNEDLLAHNDLVRHTKSELRQQLLAAEQGGIPASTVEEQSGGREDLAETAVTPFVVVREESFTLDPLQGI